MSSSPTPSVIDVVVDKKDLVQSGVKNQSGGGEMGVKALAEKQEVRIRFGELKHETLIPGFLFTGGGKIPNQLQIRQ